MHFIFIFFHSLFVPYRTFFFFFFLHRPLFQRVLKMANDHAGYDLKPPGQEGFTIIQYNKEDQYT